jgi:4-amino-4-deoxy-L-arabinose transferase-like glycosyltransferase
MKRARFLLSDTALLLVLAGCGALMHILLNGQYGFHRDELDILANARQLDWGFVAYPPFTPFIARVGLELFGSSLRGLRLFSALAQGLVMLLAGLMARDMGGRRSAQVLAAIAAYIAPAALMAGTLIQYMAFDFLWWVVIAFFFVRLLASRDARYWMGVGAAIGLGMMTKFTVAFWVAGLVVAVLLSSRRKDLLSKWLWLGAAVALVIYLPNLIWQIQHNFISLDFLKAIHARDLQWGRGDNFLPEQLTSATNPFALPLWIAGLAACLFAPSMRRFRPLAWMFLTTFLIFLVARGRGYYVAPAYVMLTAAGSAWWMSWLNAASIKLRRAGPGLLYGLVAVGGLTMIVIVKPVAPVGSDLWKITSRLNAEVVEMIGWEDLVSQVAAVSQKIPPEERAGAAILAGNYGEAGALDLYGRGMDFPPLISGADNFWYRGYGDPEPQTVVVVGFDGGYANKFFQSCTYAGTVKNNQGIPNEESTRHTGLYLCRGPRRPWSQMWPEMLWFQ